MQENPASIQVDRPLKPEELALVRWMLEHGTPEAAPFLEQLERVRVIGLCACGCVSIDFSVSGTTPPKGVGMQILADFHYKGPENPCGAFVYAKGGLLAGLDVYAFGGPAKKLPGEKPGISFGGPAVKTLPKPCDLRPVHKPLRNEA